MSSEDFRENHREGIDTTGGAKISGYEGRLSSLPNIIDPTTRMEHKRSKFSKKWATIDGSLGIFFALPHHHLVAMHPGVIFPKSTSSWWFQSFFREIMRNFPAYA